jgi:hypothetical protein
MDSIPFVKESRKKLGKFFSVIPVNGTIPRLVTLVISVFNEAANALSGDPVGPPYKKRRNFRTPVPN